jgi:hypothetical protein
MRPDKLLMLGVVGLGFYAAYRLLTSTTSTSLPPPPDKPNPLPVPTGALPLNAGPLPSPPANISTVDGDPLNLRGGQWYHGRLELSPSATREQVSGQLLTMGFKNLSVYVTPLEASQDIFQAFALANPGAGTRWFRARWPLFDDIGNVRPKPRRPNGLAILWVAAPPMV